MIKAALAFLLSFSVLAAAGDDTESCGALLSGNRYYGAFVTSFDSGKLTLEDLREALKSSEPYQPLIHSTSDPKSGAAKRFFAEAVQDPKVRAQWDETKILLAEFLQTKLGIENMRSEAEQATNRILAPVALHHFLWNEETEPAFTELPNGQVAIAMFERDKGRISDLVVVTPEGHELHRTKFPMDAASWLWTWHKDESGEVWLYLVGKIVHPATFDHFVFRMKWSTKEITEVVRTDEARAKLGTASRLQSVGNKYVLLGAEGKALLNLALDKVRFTGLFGVAGIAQMAALDHNGALALRDHVLGYFYNNVIYKSTDGHTYKITSEDQDLKISTTDNFIATTLKSDTRTEAVLATEDLDGNLLIAKSGHKPSVKTLEIYKPSAANTAIFTAPISYQNPILHWFHGPRGEVLLGAATPDSLEIVDFEHKSHVSIPTPGRVYGWFSTKSQTYFYTITDGKLQIYSINQDASRGPSSVEQAPVCDARLSGNRYYGAFVTCVETKRLESSALTEALKSDKPYNPYADITPLTNQISAKRLFSDIVQDPEVQAKWSETKELLAQYARKVEGLETIREDAIAASRYVLNPVEIHSLEVPSNSLEWTQLPDGQVAAAYVRAVPGNLEQQEIIVITPEGNEIHRQPFPAGFEHPKSWAIGWHTDKMKTQWLYVAVGDPDHTEHKTAVFRMDWAKKKYELVIGGSKFLRAGLFKSFSNEYMILIPLDAAAIDVSVPGRFNTMPFPYHESPQSAAVAPGGKLVTAIRERVQALLNDAKGVMFSLIDESSWLKLRWTDEEGPHEVTMPGKMPARNVIGTITDEGRLLAAKFGFIGRDNTGIEIYSPFEQTTPVFKRELPEPGLDRADLHFFKGAHARYILGVKSVKNLHLVDVWADTLISTPMPDKIDKWFSSREQTYLSTIRGDRVHIYKMLSAPRGPSSIEESGSCERRLEGNRYYGAFHALVKSGKLGLEQLKLALQSETPYDPYAQITPLSKEAPAKHFFAQAVQDRDVRAQWNETKLLLAKLFEKLEAAAGVSHDAAANTQRILAPKELHSFPYDLDDYPAFTELPDGQVAMAYSEKTGGQITHLRVITPEGIELHRAKLPHNTDGWAMEWHRDPAGEVWLYFASFKATQTVSVNYVYRMNWRSKEISPVLDNVYSGLTGPFRLRSVGNRYILLSDSGDHCYDISSGQPQFLAHNSLKRPQNVTLLADGKVAFRNAGADSGGLNIVFTLANGLTYDVQSPGYEIRVRARGRTSPDLQLESEVKTLFLRAAETDEGHLIVVQNGPHQSKSVVEFFMPEISTAPVFSTPIAQRTPTRLVQWFRGPRGELLTGVANTEILTVINPVEKSVISIPIAGLIYDWFATATQSYFYTVHGGRLHIMSVNQVGEE